MHFPTSLVNKQWCIIQYYSFYLTQACTKEIKSLTSEKVAIIFLHWLRSRLTFVGPFSFRNIHSIDWRLYLVSNAYIQVSLSMMMLYTRFHILRLNRLRWALNHLTHFIFWVRIKVCGIQCAQTFLTNKWSCRIMVFIAFTPIFKVDWMNWYVTRRSFSI